MIFINWMARPRFVALLSKIEKAAEEGTGHEITSKGAGPSMVSGRNRRDKQKPMPSSATSPSTPFTSESSNYGIHNPSPVEEEAGQNTKEEAGGSSS